MRGCLYLVLSVPGTTGHSPQFSDRYTVFLLQVLHLTRTSIHTSGYGPGLSYLPGAPGSRIFLTNDTHGIESSAALLHCCCAALRSASLRSASRLSLCSSDSIYCLLPDVTTQCSGRGRLHRLTSPSRSPCPSQVSRRRDGALRLALTAAGPANLVMGAI
jgi:hypothetical protein